MTIDEICGMKVDTKKITNIRLKNIIESYRKKDGFLFFGESYGTKHTDRHIDKGGRTVSSPCAQMGWHQDEGSYDDSRHEDRYEEHSEYNEYDDHADHTDKPHTEYSEVRYTESEYHTDSTSPHYRK